MFEKTVTSRAVTVILGGVCPREVRPKNLEIETVPMDSHFDASNIRRATGRKL